MPADFNSPALHEKARAIADRGDIADISAAEQIWLEDHLQECSECRRYVETTLRVIRELGMFSFPMDSDLVARTQDALTRRAQQLESEHSRHRVFLRAFALACLFTGLGSVLAWQVSAWIAQQSQLAAWKWEAGLALFWILPSLAITMLLVLGLARADARRGARSVV